MSDSDPDSEKSITELKEENRLGTINKWEPPEGDWAIEYSWTKYRGPKPWPVPGGWVFKNPEGSGWWQYYGDLGEGEHSKNSILESLKEEIDEIGHVHNNLEEARGITAGLQVQTANPDEISAANNYEDEKLEWTFKIDGETVFKQVDPDREDLMKAVAEGLQAYHEGNLEERIADIKPSSETQPEKKTSKKDIEKRREENEQLTDFK